MSKQVSFNKHTNSPPVLSSGSRGDGIDDRIDEKLDINEIELDEPMAEMEHIVDNRSPSQSPIKMTLDLSTIL